MAIECAEFEFTANTTTGDQTIVSGLSFTPKAYILFCSRNTSDATYQDSHGLLVGFSDGTTSRCVSFHSRDAEGTSIAGESIGTTVITMPDTSTPNTTVDAVASHSSFGSGTITINWSNAPSSAFKFYGICWGGADLSAEVKEYQFGTTLTGNADYTGVSFQPEVGFFLCPDHTSNSTSKDHASLGFGAAVSSTKRFLTSWASEHDRATSDTWSASSSSKCVGCVSELSGTFSGRAQGDFVSWLSNGVRINWEHAPTDSTKLFFALFMSGGDWDVVKVAKRTSTGTTTVSPSVNTIKGIVGVSTCLQENDTTEVAHARASIGVASSTSAQGGLWSGDQDNAGTTISAKRCEDSNFLIMATEASTATSSTTEALASISSMSTTFDLNYSVCTTLAADIYFVVCGESTDTPLVVNKIHKYNILNAVTKNTIHKYNILNTVTKSSIHKYNILNQVLKTSIHKWTMYEQLGKTSIHKWNMGGILTKSSIHKYNILNQVITTSIHKYNLEEAWLIYTKQRGYNKELRAKIIFMTRDKQQTYYTYDPFDPDNRPFNLTGWNVRLAIGEVGSFQLTIEDHNRNIDKNKIGLGVRVLIQVTKDDQNIGGLSPYQTLITGFVRRCRPIRNATGTLEYSITGYGSQIIFNERVVNFKRAAKRVEIDSTIPLQTDERMKAKNLFLDLINATDILPLGKPSIKNTGGFSDSEISNSNVDDFIAQIGQGLTDAATVANALAEVTGAIWGVDNNDSAFFKYASSEHSGIIIKGTASDSDLAKIISYNMAPFEFEDSIDIGDGFANRLYVLNAVDTKSTASSSGALGSSTLTFNGIAQQFTATDNNITGAAFILSKVGNPTNEDNGIRGSLRADNNGYPTGPTLASFTITFDQIETSKSTVFVNDIKTEPGVIVPGNKYWWFLFGALIDDSNTVRWHHDNDQVTPNRLSATLPLIDNDPSTPGIQVNWIRSVFGPVYSFSTFSSVRHILTQSDDDSIKRYGLIEAVVDLPAFEDDYTFQKALYKIIQYSAKPKRLYQYNTLTIPFGKIFLPGQLVTVIDDKSDLTTEKNVLAEIQEVNYNCDTSSNAMGCKYVDIRLMGFVDAATEEALENLDC